MTKSVMSVNVEFAQLFKKWIELRKSQKRPKKEVIEEVLQFIKLRYSVND